VANAAPGIAPTIVSDTEEEGQLVEVKFRAAKAGKYSLQLMCMSGVKCCSALKAHALISINMITSMRCLRT